MCKKDYAAHIIVAQSTKKDGDTTNTYSHPFPHPIATYLQFQKLVILRICEKYHYYGLAEALLWDMGAHCLLLRHLLLGLR